MCRHTSDVVHTCYTYTHLNPWAWVTHTALHTHICTSWFRCLHRCTCAHSWLHAWMGRGTRTHIGLYTPTWKRMLMQSHPCTTHTQTHTCNPHTQQSLTHTEPHPCRNAHTHTQTHTQANMLSCPCNTRAGKIHTSSQGFFINIISRPPSHYSGHHGFRRTQPARASFSPSLHPFFFLSV